jgi:hypothetical protein
MRLKRKRKKNRSRFHLPALDYASRNPWRKQRRRQRGGTAHGHAIAPAESVESKIFVAVPPTPTPSATADEARMRGCTRVNTWRAS